jgi:hypothetical protein
VSDLASDPPAESSSPSEGGLLRLRVDPAPDGRGARPESKPPMIPRSRLFIAILLGLLVVLIRFAACFHLRPADEPELIGRR